MRLQRLGRLDVSGSKHADPAALTEFISAHGTTLRTLVLDGVASVRDEHIKAIVTSCTALRSLSVAGCTSLTDASLAALASSPCAGRLHALNINGCQGMTGHGLQQFIVASARSRRQEPSYGTVANRLRSVEARGIHPSGVCDVLLYTLTQATPSLETLDLTHADPFGYSTAGLLKSVQQGCAQPSAPSPSMSSSRNGSKGAADALEGMVCPPSDLALSPALITDAGLRLLAGHAGGLKVLRLGGHAALTDTGAASAVSRLPLLSALDLRGCRGVGDGLLQAMAKGGHARIAELRLTHSSRLTDAGLSALHQADFALRSLRVLDIAGCKAVSFPGLQRLVHAWGDTAAKALQEAQGAELRVAPALYVGGIPAVRKAVQASGVSSPSAGEGGDAYRQGQGQASHALPFMQGMVQVKVC